jgi:hypothetical protein
MTISFAEDVVPTRAMRIENAKQEKKKMMRKEKTTMRMTMLNLSRTQ